MPEMADRKLTRVPREVLWDEDVYARELRTVFRKSWQFVGHDSEIPSPGDYVTRRMGQESVIVARDEAGKVRIFQNPVPTGAISCVEPARATRRTTAAGTTAGRSRTRVSCAACRDRRS